MTDAEHRLWQQLRAGRLRDARFRRQAPIGNYIADFVSFEHRLVVEADGGQHAGSQRDEARDRWFESQGFRVLRVRDDDILARTPDVLERIATAIEEHTLSPPPPPSRGRGERRERGGAPIDSTSAQDPHPRSAAHRSGAAQNARQREASTGTLAEKPLPHDRGRVGQKVKSGAAKADSSLQSASREVRIYGLNACLAAFAARPQDLRKVYLAESRIAALRDVLAHCVRHRLGYRVVEEADLDRLAASSHHEGVVFDLRRREQPTLPALLAALPPGPQVLLWLDGVGNPHNFGAVLRSAAHFGAAAVLLPPSTTLTLSGAACRVAEGGAEVVPVVTIEHVESALPALRAAGFTLAATLPRGGTPLYRAELPQRLVIVFGAEGSGLHGPLLEACALRLSIPGSGRVESLNIANAVGVVLGECWRRHHA